MKKEQLKKYKFSNKAGVYFFLKNKEIIYIGKATSLKNRIQSYFSPNLLEKRGPLLVEMLKNSTKIKSVETDTVLEALILEAELIKKHLPKYNTEGRSDKSWNYVCITKEKVPELLLVRERQIDFNEKEWKGRKLDAIFGPFTNGGQLQEALRIIRKIFPYMDVFSSRKANYAFYQQTRLAPDVLSEEGKKIYKTNIKNIKLFFKGKKKLLLKELKKKMKEEAKKREFEKANEYKRQILALQHINDIALLKRGEEERGGKIFFKNEKHFKTFRIEAYDVAHLSGKNMVGVMTVVEITEGLSEVAKKEYKKFKIRTKKNADDTGALKEILERRLAHKEWQYPDLIVVDGNIAQINTTRKVLKENGKKIPVVSVIKNERHKPEAISGDENYTKKYKSEILLSNSEAHRFAIAYHKNLRGKSFLTD